MIESIKGELLILNLDLIYSLGIIICLASSGALPLHCFRQSLNLVRFEINSNPVFGQPSCHRSKDA